MFPGILQSRISAPGEADGLSETQMLVLLPSTPHSSYDNKKIWKLRCLQTGFRGLVTTHLTLYSVKPDTVSTSTFTGEKD